MNFDQFKKAVIHAAGENGLAEYELYYQYVSADGVETFDGQIEKFNSNVAQGVCLRGIVDGKMGYASTELFTPEEAVSLVKKAIESGKSVDAGEEAILYSGGGKYEKLPIVVTGSVDMAKDIGFALKLESDCMKADNRVVTGTQCAVGETTKIVKLYNSKGLDLERSGRMTDCFISAVAEAGGEKYNAYSFATAHRLEDVSGEELVREAVDKTLAQIGAKSIPSGKYRVVLDNLMMAAILDIYTPVFSSKNAQDGLSLLKGKEGQRIASDPVTLVDDPVYPAACFPSSFDGEGVPTKKKNIIESGTLTTLLYNLKTAAKEGKESTGNAYKASYASSVSIAPYSFYLKPTATTTAALYAQAGDAILITEMKGAHAGANPVTGDFSLEAKGFRIENGVKTYPVEGITIAGNFFQLLSNIIGISDDLRFEYGGGSSICGSPSVLISELSVAGSGQGE